MTEDKKQWIQSHADLVASLITLLGFLARLWAASGVFLNPDEALHFRLANQLSLALAYKASLTAAHPPLLTFLLYFWRALGTSELWLRLPSVIAGTVFCWMFYEWLSKAAGELTGLIGLLLVALLPTPILMAAEIRQYSLLLAFLASAVYFLDESFRENSTLRMTAFSVCLYLAMLSHYSAFWFAIALGLYALFRIFTERPPAKLVAAWAIGQLGGLALAVFFYETHLSKLGVGDSRTALQGYMSDFYLRRSFFDRAHDNPLTFLVGHTFGVFQYLCAQLAVGDVLGLFFIAGVVLLLCGKNLAQNRISARRLGLFVFFSFAVAGSAALAHVYPYGGTRHVAFLIIPAVAGASVAMARLAAWKWASGVGIAALVIIACLAFANPRRPTMSRTDQSRKNMAAAMDFVANNVAPSDLIFVDYQTDLILGHYLCRQRPISFETSPARFEQFSCGERHIISADYKSEWMFWADNFAKDWRQFVQTYNLKPGQSVWIFQAGWGVDLPADLQKHFAEFRDLRFTSFGRNVKIFRMTVGQPMPAVAP